MKRLLLIAAIALPALAQTTIKDALVKHWKTTGDFTLAVAKAMPAESYGYKPVPEEMSFSQVLVQVAGANMNACSNASGMPRPAIPPKIAENVKAEKDTDKEMVVQFLADTFNFCNQAVASMTPEKLDAMAGTTRKMTGFEWLWSYFTHTAHHRGQLEVYLRLKGIKPPDYTF
jgi:uncharacterized damage-inducible protein DinB